MAKLGLGTVHFGMDYGIANTLGQTTPEEVLTILESARSSHIQTLDTAPCYGGSEAVLGDALAQLGSHDFRIVTKTPQFGSARISRAEAEEVERTFERSLANLRQSSVDALLVHDANNLLVPGGEFVFEAMGRLKQEARVGKRGVSVYEPAQLEALLARYDIDLIQLPLSILDQRFIESGLLSVLKQKGIEIHARSVFLQGLLLMPESTIPAPLSAVAETRHRLDSFVNETGLSLVQAALCFVNQQPEVDIVLMGVRTSNEFKKNAADFASIAGLEFDFSPFSIHDEALVNPSKWEL
ncbi:MAG TPA: aldo/keto reductase [Candidatus Hydrogenedentes bacterium]|nr:aldo/keto reductase [Candidatus Hydrogenedentota bacterium]